MFGGSSDPQVLVPEGSPMKPEQLNTSEKVAALFGSRVKTTAVLSEPANFRTITTDKHIESRRPNAEGVVIAQPNQGGGDAFAIDHQDGTPPAIYWYHEFERI